MFSALGDFFMNSRIWIFTSSSECELLLKCLPIKVGGLFLALSGADEGFLRFLIAAIAVIFRVSLENSGDR